MFDLSLSGYSSLRRKRISVGLKIVGKYKRVSARGQHFRSLFCRYCSTKTRLVWLKHTISFDSIFQSLNDYFFFFAPSTLSSRGMVTRPGKITRFFFYSNLCIPGGFYSFVSNRLFSDCVSCVVFRNWKWIVFSNRDVCHASKLN